MKGLERLSRLLHKPCGATELDAKIVIVDQYEDLFQPSLVSYNTKDPYSLLVQTDKDMRRMKTFTIPFHVFADAY
jgi:hypothetical protein